MQTTLVTVELGGLALAAPTWQPRHVLATHGHLWQWVGDGRELISLSVATRETRLGTPAGVRDHLRWEAKQVAEALDGDAGQARPVDVLVRVDGASAAAAADVDGRMRGLDVHNRLIVATDGRLMHVVRVLVPDNPAGRELSEAVASGLAVQTSGAPR